MHDTTATLGKYLASIAIFGLCGCAAVGPNYVAPVLSGKDVPEQWTSRTDVPPATETAPTARPGRTAPLALVSTTVPAPTARPTRTGRLTGSQPSPSYQCVRPS